MKLYKNRTNPKGTENREIEGFEGFRESGHDWLPELLEEEYLAYVAGASVGVVLKRMRALIEEAERQLRHDEAWKAKREEKIEIEKAALREKRPSYDFDHVDFPGSDYVELIEFAKKLAESNAKDGRDSARRKLDYSDRAYREQVIRGVVELGRLSRNREGLEAAKADLDRFLEVVNREAAK